ncbi:YppG family protein [Oceanobacillus manasiensis]|uniref:YppG family protein n=1 Tax=Oceanobacillus manasiensis TaxID=586413 RepID=UPI0005AB5016|nr:YppG family protein [Oceanobacillus manasiensis]
MYHRPYDQYNNHFHNNYNMGISELQYQQPNNIPPNNAAYQSTPFHTPYAYFAKPPQPVDWPKYMQTNSPINAQTQSDIGTGSNANEFPQNGGGQFDLDKVLSTVGQIANTYHQVSPIVKQFGSVMKLFR